MTDENCSFDHTWYDAWLLWNAARREKSIRQLPVGRNRLNPSSGLAACTADVGSRNGLIAGPVPAAPAAAGPAVRLLNAVDSGVIQVQAVVQRLAQRVNGDSRVVDGLSLVAAEVVRSGFHQLDPLVHVMDGLDDSRVRSFFGLN